MNKEPRFCAQRGISLPEVLVAISLAIVLIAFGISGIRGISIKSRAITCLSQLRQIGQAFSGYLSENNGRYPPSVGGYYPEVGWAGIWYRPTTAAKPHGLGLAAYTGGEDQLMKLSVCPENRSSVIVPPCINPYGYPYIVNYHLLPSLPFPICQINNVRQPSKTLLLADCVKDSDWALGTPTLLEAGGGWRLSEKHQDRLNVLWADGHASSLRKIELSEANFRYQTQAP